MAQSQILAGAQVEHIGSAPHPTRNRMIALIGVTLVVVIGLYTVFIGRADKGYAAELDRFRQQMFDKCKMEQFAGATSPQLASLYADSSRMQDVVEKQMGALSGGQVHCDDVLKALRSVDYPVR